MAYLKFRGCGHLVATQPIRSLHQTPRDGLCPKCIRQRRLVQTLITVHVRKTLFTHISAADKSPRCVYGERFDPPFSMRDRRRKRSTG